MSSERLQVPAENAAERELGAVWWMCDVERTLLGPGAAWQLADWFSVQIIARALPLVAGSAEMAELLAAVPGSNAAAILALPLDGLRAMLFARRDALKPRASRAKAANKLFLVGGRGCLLLLGCCSGCRVLALAQPRKEGLLALAALRVEEAMHRKVCRLVVERRRGVCDLACAAKVLVLQTLQSTSLDLRFELEQGFQQLFERRMRCRGVAQRALQKAKVDDWTLPAPLDPLPNADKVEDVAALELNARSACELFDPADIAKLPSLGVRRRTVFLKARRMGSLASNSAAPMPAFKLFCRKDEL